MIMIKVAHLSSQQSRVVGRSTLNGPRVEMIDFSANGGEEEKRSVVVARVRITAASCSFVFTRPMGGMGVCTIEVFTAWEAAEILTGTAVTFCHDLFLGFWIYPGGYLMQQQRGGAAFGFGKGSDWK